MQSNKNRWLFALNDIYTVKPQNHNRIEFFVCYQHMLLERVGNHAKCAWFVSEFHILLSSFQHSMQWKSMFFFHERFIICVKHTVPIHTHTRIRIHYMRDTFYARMRFTSHIAQIPCVLTQNHGISISISFYSELFFSCLFIVTLAAIIIWNLFGCNAIPLCSEGWTRDEGRKTPKIPM